MPLYSQAPKDEAKSCKARGSNLRVHFKVRLDSPPLQRLLRRHALTVSSLSLCRCCCCGDQQSAHVMRYQLMRSELRLGRSVLRRIATSNSFDLCDGDWRLHGLVMDGDGAAADAMPMVLMALICSEQNTRETAYQIRGYSLKKAKQYLEDVIAHKDIVPFRRYH
jgi:hypothetical protein